MSVDPTKLRAAVRRLSKEAGQQKKKDSLTASIRELLPVIKQLREDEGATWRVIAAALAEQGVTEGKDGKPVSERRLTSVITKLKTQAEAKAALATNRKLRADITEQSETRGPAAVSSNANLDDVGGPDAPPVPPEEALLTEEEILRLQQERHRHLFKKDRS